MHTCSTENSTKTSRNTTGTLMNTEDWSEWTRSDTICNKQYRGLTKKKKKKNFRNKQIFTQVPVRWTGHDQMWRLFLCRQAEQLWNLNSKNSKQKRTIREEITQSWKWFQPKKKRDTSTTGLWVTSEKTASVSLPSHTDWLTWTTKETQQPPLLINWENSHWYLKPQA